MVKNLFRTSPSLLVYIGLILISFSCIRDTEVDERLQSVRAAKRGVGVSANEILSSNEYSGITLEIHYMNGYAPSQQTLDDLTQWLISLANKPDGINVQVSEIPAVGQEKYTLQEVRDIEDDNRNAYNSGNRLGMYILILDGYFDEDSDTEVSLGFSHRNTSIALLGRRIAENSDRFGKPSKEKLETTVLEHEIGHLLGLVNLGTNMVLDHEDEDHDRHCDNEDCLMYWAVETNILSSSLQNSIPVLDQNCRNDLRGNGGK